MIEYPMSKTYSIDDAVWIEVDGVVRHFCPVCAEEHDFTVVSSHTTFYDCKSVFFDEDGEAFGQCMCYAKEHGTRER